MNPSASLPPKNDPQYWTSPFEVLLDQPGNSGASPSSADVQRPNSILGTPGQDAAAWEGPQRHPDDCAIKCQQFILQQFTGQHFDEDVLVREAFQHGWYSPGAGTPTRDVGNLLELHGVGVNRYEHGNQFYLAYELAQGHKVIVGVESDKLWNHNPVLEGIKEALGIHGPADHAVVVSGIDTSDPQHVLVQVSDPGTGEVLAKYPMEQFLDAWKSSDFFMVATHEPAPSNLPEMAHFDYGLGHIPEIADVPYGQFLEYLGRPDAWETVIHHYVEVHHHVHIHVDDVPDLGHHNGGAFDLGATNLHGDLSTGHHMPDAFHGDDASGLGAADPHSASADHYPPDAIHADPYLAADLPDNDVPQDLT